MNSAEGLRGFITFLILSGILITGVIGFNFISQPVNTTSQADENKIEPLNVVVNNIKDSSAEISWTTIEPSTAKLVYSTDLNAKCLTDTSSLESCISVNSAENQTSHSKVLTNLVPETTYFFKIISNDKLYPVDTNHSFRTDKAFVEPSKTEIINKPDDIAPGEDYSGFSEVDTLAPEVIKLNKQVLGAQDENLEGVEEPTDPLGDIDKMMQEQFNEAVKFNDVRFDFNKDGDVTMADYPLFMNFVLSE